MPRLSHRRQQLRMLEKTLEVAILLDSSSDDSMDSTSSNEGGQKSLLTDSDSENSAQSFTAFDEETGDINSHSDITELWELYFLLYNTRYLEVRTVTPKSDEFARQFFDKLPAHLFRQMTRMDKPTFFYLLSLIQDDPVFKNESNHSQMPVVRQLAVCLDRLGHHGNEACLNHLIPTWGISTGTLVNISNRCFHVLETALADEVSWPSPAERQDISDAFALKGFPGYVGLIDGTLLKLAQRPHLHGEMYFDRKCRYSVNAQVVCDHQLKILLLFTGLPGTFYDSTCLKRSSLWDYVSTVGPNALFERAQYLLGDSAYPSLPHLVGAYKRADISSQRKDFNICVAKCRVTTEHSIGLLKSRWRSLKEIRVQLNAKKDSVHLVKWISLCAKLHNFVINQNDHWTEEEFAPDISLSDEDTSQDPFCHVPQQVSRPDIAAVSNALLTEVMSCAIAHHRNAGTFEAMDRH